MMLTLVFLAQAAAASPAPALTPTPAPDPALDPIAIVGGTVWTMDGPPIEGGTVLFREGKIVDIGKGIEIPGRAKRIDATGKIVTPGFVDAATTLGLTEIDLGAPGTKDASLEDGSVIRAAFRAVDGLNPASALIPVTRMEGVTTVVAVPNGGIVTGQSAAFRLTGARVEEMLTLFPVAMHADVGEAAHGFGGGTRGGVWRKLREAFEDARVLRDRKAAFEENRSRALSAPRLDLLALQPVIEGKLPLAIDAHRASDILAALRFAREEKVRLVITGASEGWRVAGDLAEAKVPVVVNPMVNLPDSFQSLGARYDNAKLLDEKGVTVVIASGDAHNVRKLRQLAGNAISWGMPREKALAAVTRTPAEVYGLSAGVLAKGRAADVVVWSGDPFELTTNPIAVFIDGREVPLRSRQTELLERYRTLPPAR